MSAGRDDKARTKDRKHRIRKALREWKLHRQEVRKRINVRRATYK